MKLVNLIFVASVEMVAITATELSPCIPGYSIPTGVLEHIAHWLTRQLCISVY